PANGLVTVDLSGFAGQQLTVTATNSIGQQLYSEQLISGGNKKIDTGAWPTGLYVITVETAAGRYTGKLMKTE
ncbi:T9SS type A sorting domain-containing protein, partial [Citrobacter freundii]|uniref:T9SS type A sorting domain-containing protein n=1 Tax=Citrobacter freundii TaxID=546 RepID=UPI003A98708D